MPNFREEARSLPTSGFQVIDADHLVEEEELPDYKEKTDSIPFDWVRFSKTSIKLLDSFQITGPDGKHVVLVFEAAQMSLWDMKLVFRRDGFDEGLVKGAVIELLEALDFLHTYGEIVYTGIMSIQCFPRLTRQQQRFISKLEQKEFSSPVPRKPVSSSRAIYLSRLILPKEGPMLLSDFGEARIGAGPHGGDIMPLEYRAPEALLYVGWSYPVDIWSVGLTAWDLLEPKRLFTARDEDGNLYDAVHLAQLATTPRIPR
ncbi:hypothetical protein APSETT444_002926 [Aspergillus pseudonomiae]